MSMRLLRRRGGRRRDFVAELAPAREWLVDVTVYRGLVDRLQDQPDFRGSAPADVDGFERVTIAVPATRREIANRAACRRVERLGVAVFEATTR